MASFSCPYLKGSVELSAEREQHIAESHPDLLPAHRDLIASTLADPDQIRSSKLFGSARLFSRWYADLKGGKPVVVVVVVGVAKTQLALPIALTHDFCCRSAGH